MSAPATRRAEPFFDARLSPKQNKAVEMTRNGFSIAEVAEEMMIERRAVHRLLNIAERKGVQVDRVRAAARAGVSLFTLVTVRAALLEAGHPKRGLAKAISDRTGVSENSVSVRLCRYDHGYGPTIETSQPKE